MKLANLRRILCTGCIVKIKHKDSEEWVFTGLICDLTDRYDGYEVIKVYNINDFEACLIIVIE